LSGVVEEKKMNPGKLEKPDQRNFAETMEYKVTVDDCTFVIRENEKLMDLIDQTRSHFKFNDVGRVIIDTRSAFAAQLELIDKLSMEELWEIFGTALFFAYNSERTGMADNEFAALMESVGDRDSVSLTEDVEFEKVKQTFVDFEDEFRGKCTSILSEMSGLFMLPAKLASMWVRGNPLPPHLLTAFGLQMIRGMIIPLSFPVVPPVEAKRKDRPKKSSTKKKVAKKVSKKTKAQVEPKPETRIETPTETKAETPTEKMAETPTEKMADSPTAPAEEKTEAPVEPKATSYAASLGIRNPKPASKSPPTKVKFNACETPLHIFGSHFNIVRTDSENFLVDYDETYVRNASNARLNKMRLVTVPGSNHLYFADALSSTTSDQNPKTDIFWFFNPSIRKRRCQASTFFVGYRLEHQRMDDKTTFYFAVPELEEELESPEGTRTFISKKFKHRMRLNPKKLIVEWEHFNIEDDSPADPFTSRR
jgi:hypothetical protein